MMNKSGKWRYSSNNAKTVYTFNRSPRVLASLVLTHLPAGSHEFFKDYG